MGKNYHNYHTFMIDFILLFYLYFHFIEAKFLINNQAQKF